MADRGGSHPRVDADKQDTHRRPDTIAQRR
jgi:hypothetical protein